MRLRRFAKVMSDEKKGEDVVGRVQRFAKGEEERKKKQRQEEAAAKKKTALPSIAPQKGFLGRMYDKYASGKKEK